MPKLTMQQKLERGRFFEVAVGKIGIRKIEKMMSVPGTVQMINALIASQTGRVR